MGKSTKCNLYIIKIDNITEQFITLKDMADHLTISTADENNFDWETMLPSNSTATTVSESPVISLNERITKLELLVNFTYGK